MVDIRVPLVSVREDFILITGLQTSDEFFSSRLNLRATI
jgi:hypothetical protein